MKIRTLYQLSVGKFYQIRFAEPGQFYDLGMVPKKGGNNFQGFIPGFKIIDEPCLVHAILTTPACI